MNNDNKPWYEKLGICISIFAGIFTILGISIWGIFDKFSNDTSTISKQQVIQETTNNISVDNKTEVENTTEKEIESISNIEDNTDSSNEKITPIENHTPNDSATNVYILNWDANSDVGIDGNMYSGGIKIDMSNMFTSLGSNASNTIESRIILPLPNSKDTEEKIFSGTFVLDNSMYGSKSFGTIKIIINNKEVFSTGQIDGNTIKSFPFKVDYSKADTVIIETNATLIGSSFIYGLVNSKE